MNLASRLPLDADDLGAIAGRELRQAPHLDHEVEDGHAAAVRHGLGADGLAHDLHLAVRAGGMGHDHVHSRCAHEFADDPLHLLRELGGRLADRDHVIDQRRGDLSVGAHRHFGIELRVAQHVDLESVARPYDVLAGSRGSSSGGRTRSSGSRRRRRGRRADRRPLGWRLDGTRAGHLRHGAVATAREAGQNERQDERASPSGHRAVMH